MPMAIVGQESHDLSCSTFVCLLHIYLPYGFRPYMRSVGYADHDFGARMFMAWAVGPRA